jgi:4-amino-4-deoxy-L-arabinose transferase-like glycosyltransferase
VNWPWLIAALAVALELGATLLGPYGWFIDELYYRACAQRLAWGYVDHPPLSIAVLAFSRAWFGDSLLAMRAWPALALAGAALTSSALARRLGGTGFARALAALCVLSSPVALILGSFFSMNAIELLLWPLCALLFLELLESGGILWLGFGALIGLAILNKHTSATFGAALLAGSLLTPAREQLRTRWPWLGALVTALILSPNLIWQVQHGWASLEFYEQAQKLKNIETPALRVLANQALVAGPTGLPLAILGVAALLRDQSRRAALALGAGFVALLAALMLSHSSRFERLIGYYPILFAAGAAALERAADGGRAWLRAAALGVVPLGAVALAPISLPLFPSSLTGAYARGLGIVPQIEKNRSGALPQWFSDRLAWPELVETVAPAYRALSVDERAHALLFAPSYGEAGALELWGPALGLPPVISNHNTYYSWSQRLLALREASAPEAASSIVLITVGISTEQLQRWFERVDQAGAFECADCVDWRRHRPILVARAPRASLLHIWPQLKHYE